MRKLSVIIPVYNSEKYLDKCIGSVLQNDFEDFELILIDDGSTDKSGEICDAYAAHDQRIVVSHQRNGGVSKARNSGIDLAQSDYVLFIDSDDYIPKNYLSSLFNHIEQGYDLALCSVRHFYLNGDVSDNCACECEIDFSNISADDKTIFLELNRQYLLYGPVNKIYKKSILTDYKISFPEDMSYGEDLIFNFAYLNHCRNLIYRHEPVYFYCNQNDSSLSSVYRSDRFWNEIRISETIDAFFEEKGLKSKEYEAFISHRIFDSAYNHICGYWNRECTLSLKEKLSEIKKILNNKSVVRCLELYDFSQYPGIDVSLMKKKRGALFFFMHSLILKAHSLRKATGAEHNAPNA